MNRNILSVMRKEFARFFKDPRMVITALILPGVMIYAVYSFMGVALKDMFVPSDTHVPVINAVNMPVIIGQLAEQSGFEIVSVAESEIESIKTQITNKETDLLMVFESDFDEIVVRRSTDALYDSMPPAAPNIEIYYNPVSPDSGAAYDTITGVLTFYEESLVNPFNVNFGIEGSLASEEDVMAFGMSSLLPFLLIMMMFTGCMSLAPESISGEKERGTIATILVTPIKRSEFAIGKIISLGVLSFLCGLSSLIGIFLSLPKMMSIGSETDLSMNIYTISDYVMIALIVISTVIVIVALVSIISAFAKTVKEATTMVMPLMIIVMVIGVSSMFGGGTADIKAYLIPLYGSVQAMSGIFKFDYSITNIAVTVASNIVYAFAGGFILTRMFNSERVVFSK